MFYRHVVELLNRRGVTLESIAEIAFTYNILITTN